MMDYLTDYFGVSVETANNNVTLRVGGAVYSLLAPHQAVAVGVALIQAGGEMARALEESENSSENSLRTQTVYGLQTRRRCPDCDTLVWDTCPHCLTEVPESPPKPVSRDGGDRGRAHVIHTDLEPTEAQMGLINDLWKQLGRVGPVHPYCFMTRLGASNLINDLKKELAQS